MKTLLLDPEDEHLRRWCNVRSDGYVEFSKLSRRTYIHRVVIPDVPQDMFVDHINGNPSDNRKENLRVVSKAENTYNKKAHSQCGYKGVRLHKQSGRWQCRITIEQRHIALGYYSTAEAAAEAYNKAATKHFGEFAKLNTIKTESRE